jgi:hypothetical protein
VPELFEDVDERGPATGAGDTTYAMGEELPL